MIPHQKSSVISWLFMKLTQGKFRKSFHRLSLTARSEIPRFEPNVPAIVVANHPSWWDALLVGELSQPVFGREYYGIFDEEQLRIYGIFRRLGGFAIEKKDGVHQASEMRNFLRYAQELLEGRNRLLWIFAQGDLISAETPIELKRGFATVASQLSRVHVLKLNVSYDYWNESKPEVTIDILPLETVTGLRGHEATEALSARVERELEESRQYLRDVVRRRDVSRLKPLWENPAGANPVYDVYRGLKSVFTGKKFSKSHAK